MEELTGLIAVVMAFSIPLTAIITAHFRKSEKLKHLRILNEIELEKLKHENFVIETQKMRLELEKMKLADRQQEDPLLFK